MPGQELSPLILPLSSSWNIALDAMKPVRSLILGVGLANYGDFASSVKPLLLNATPFWNQSIVTSGSELLQILTTTGLIGLFSVLAIPVIAFRFVRTHLEQKPKEDPTLISIIALAVISGLSLVVFPGSLPVLFVFFSAVGLLCATSPHSHSLPLQNSLAVATVGLIIFVLTGFYSYKVYAAEWHLHNAQVALAKNDGKTVYEQNLAAIKLLPTLTSYRLSYSQVNLSLASALSQKSSLSDADRQNVTQLVSQAVVEAKTATGLRPHSAATWQNLGTIYRNLINVAEGADQFAITAYAQAISLDPGNPTLRVEFGGLLYQLGTSSKNSADQALLYDRARNELQTAISLKSDYANAYYNLSKLLETTKDYGDSYLAMQKAISLLGHDSQDLGRATSELEMIKAKLPTRSTSPSDTGEGKAPASTSLSNPSPLPSPISGDKIPLPSATP
jgi:tetratricopeptide (TPR) repeat protein